MKAKKVLENLNKLNTNEALSEEIISEGGEIKKGSLIKSYHSPSYKEDGFIIGQVTGEQVDKRDGVTYVIYEPFFDIRPERSGKGIEVHDLRKYKSMRAPKNGTETMTGDTLDGIELIEGMHYGTKIRQVEGSQGTRKAKMAIREAKRLVENLLDPNHPSPNPVSDQDKQLLLDSSHNLDSAITKVSEAKVAKRVKK